LTILKELYLFRLFLQFYKHVSYMGETRNAYNILFGNNFGDVCVDGRIILKIILQEWKAKLYNWYKWLRLESI